MHMMPLSKLKRFLSPRSVQNFTTGLTQDIVWDRPVFRPPTLSNPRVIFDPQPFTTQRPLLKRTVTAVQKTVNQAAPERETVGLRRWLFATDRQRPLHG